MGDPARFASRIQPRLVQTGQRAGGNLNWRPKRIVLIRHGESAGNVDEKVYTSTPDWRIPLTPRGVSQAQAAGASLRQMMGASPEANAYFYVSPYRRAKQTYENVVAALEPSQLIGVREDRRITEQQFGNLQDKASMEQAKRDRLAFGRFYYRFAQGESALDVYARMSSFMTTLFRDEEQLRANGRLTPETHIVMVAHGLSIQLFVMRWFQLSVEQFEQFSNPPNGGAIVLERRGDPEHAQWFEIERRSWGLLDRYGTLGSALQAGAAAGLSPRHLVGPDCDSTPVGSKL